MQQEFYRKSFQAFKTVEARQHPATVERTPAPSAARQYQYKRKSTAPSNAKLNILLAKSNSELMENALVNLIERLYTHTPLMSEAMESSSHIASRILHSSLTLDLECPSDIAKIDVGSKQAIFFNMLKGSAAYPSLLSYITVIPIKNGSNLGKLNIHYVDEKVIYALTASKKCTSCLLDCRRPFIENQSAERQRIKRILEEQLPNNLASELDGLFDYTKGQHCAPYS
jgi:hypothetical protein